MSSKPATIRLGFAVPSLLGSALRYPFGLDKSWQDVRPAWLSVGVCRVAIFLAVFWALHTSLSISGANTFAEWYRLRAEASYTPFSLLRLSGNQLPQLEFWLVMRWVALASTLFAIIGFVTRPMMIISVVSSLLFVLLRISESYFWSHTWNVIFLAAIPFALCAAGSSLSLDRLIGRFVPAYPFGRRTEPVLWGVLAAQASVAIFVFGAFYAKIFHAFALGGPAGPFWYVFSDNMRNVLGVFWLGVPENVVPPWIEWAWSIPAVWMILMLGHLFMQAAPAASFVSLRKPVWRALEGLIFLLGIIALGVVANGWNWAWIPLTAFFIDWDHFLRRPQEERPAIPKTKLLAVGLPLLLFFSAYVIGIATQTANSWGLYPFSNMSFYAGFYVRPPYDRHQHYADYDIGELTLQPAPGFNPTAANIPGWCDGTNKGWAELKDKNWSRCYRFSNGQMSFPFFGNDVHRAGREEDLQRLRGSLAYAAQRLDVDAPTGSYWIAWRKTAGFPAYPAPMRRMTLHAGVRGMFDPVTDRFAGMTVDLDPDTGSLIVKQVQGETGDPKDRIVYARFNTHLEGRVLPLVQVPGRWVDDKTFVVSKLFVKKYKGQFWNGFVRTRTVFGVVDFDGPAEWL